MADKEYAPWSRETEDGLITSAVDSHVRVSQDIVPALAVGSIDKLSGKWEGVTVYDSNFLVDPTHEAVANGARVIVPQAQPDYIDMTGFSTLFIAIKTSVSGNHEIEARMGPDTNNFANLFPIGASASLRGCYNGIGNEQDLEGLFKETAESLQADVWNIFIIQGRLEGQKNLVFTIDNDTGSIENIQFAYMRVV